MLKLLCAFVTLIGLSAAQQLTTDLIESMGNNSLFLRWRQRSRIIAPAGWMNDPCGPLYDPVTGLYHIHYQWHPNHANWGNISWGHATSSDMVTWTDVDHFPNDGVIDAWIGDQAQSIGTTNLTGNHIPALYDHLGIFSGTAQPVNLTGKADGTLLAFYTSVARLPFTWDAPYPQGAESQSYALSYDGGTTWKEYDQNPVLAYPPGGWNVTGWRDPFFLQLPYLDNLLEYSEPHFYVIFGSGINGSGPRAPLYSTPASDMTKWSFLGALSEPAANISYGDPAQTGTVGYNWEVPNFFNLGDYWFVSGGIQGGIPNYHTFWQGGSISARSNGSIDFTPIAAGAADWGSLYAITSFNDTKNDRRVQIGWAWEDNNGFAITQSGYQGTLSLPKELFVMETANVVPPSNLSEIANSEYVKQQNGSYTAWTLGARPLPDVIEGLRNGSTYSCFERVRSCAGKGNAENTQVLAATTETSYELSVIITSTTGLTGVTIGASPDLEEYTSIYFDPSTYTIACNRTYSSTLTEFVNTTYAGYFEPYVSSSTNEIEPIHMRIFQDGSLVEITVNDRFWLTTRIYPSREDSTGIGLYADPGVLVEYQSIELWNGLKNVWPNRPLNSSSLLIFDTVAETNNYTWWSGN